MHQRVQPGFGQAQAPHHGQGRGAVSKVRAHMVVPPASLGLAVHDMAAPFETAHRRPPAAIQFGLAVAGIQVGNLAQQQGLAGARGAHDGRALARGKIQADGRQAFAVQAPQPEQRPGVGR
ncbi:hypothetical protein D3C87_1480790 [compost metagenome]